ncbi:YjbQ family protein [Novosphingobium barchaimii]|uniref:hypothetical protein n=1 Tax=Novosphingobium barchaimii TaxID=1420591 RepID=UPI000B0712D1|nr:hypothetical protein [Novosphingobium barchaimii]
MSLPMGRGVPSPSFDTPGGGFTDVKQAIAGWLEGTGVAEGLLTLLIQENVAREQRADLAACFDRLAPRNAPLYPRRRRAG